jgi:hypothetical protein
MVEARGAPSRPRAACSSPAGEEGDAPGLTRASSALHCRRASSAPRCCCSCFATGGRRSAHGKEKGLRRGTSEEDDEGEVAASDENDKDARAVLLLPLLCGSPTCRGGSPTSIRPTAEHHPPLGARDSTATAHRRAASAVGRLRARRRRGHCYSSTGSLRPP